MCNGGARTISQAALLKTVRLSELLNQLPVSMSNWTISTSGRPTWLSHNVYLAIYTLNKTLQPGHMLWLAPPWHRHWCWGGTTQNLGRIVPQLGAERLRLGRTWGGSTRGGSTEGRIDRYPYMGGSNDTLYSDRRYSDSPQSGRRSTTQFIFSTLRQLYTL